MQVEEAEAAARRATAAGGSGEGVIPFVFFSAFFLMTKSYISINLCPGWGSSRAKRKKQFLILKHHQNLHHLTRGSPSTTTTHHLPIMWRGKRKKSPNKHGTRSLRDIFTVQATVVNDDDRKLPARGELPCVSLPVDEDDDDRKLPARGEVPCVSLPVDKDDNGGPLPLEPATKEEEMDFDDDFSSETEFDEDSSSETEFDEDAVDFDGNDTNVFSLLNLLMMQQRRRS